MMTSSTCHQPQGQPVSATLLRDSKMVSLNCNGLLMPIQRGNKKVARYKVISKYIVAKQLDIVGLREPHNVSQTEQRKLSKAFENLGYQFCTSNSPDRCGGTTFVWSHGWAISQALALSPRILIAKFSNVDGFIVMAIRAQCMWVVDNSLKQKSHIFCLCYYL